jgi:hypothetical protein
MPGFGLNHYERRFPTATGVSANRFVKLGSDGNLVHAAATDLNVIGVSLGACGATTNVNAGALVALRNRPGCVDVEIAAAQTLQSGDIAYQAANGMVQSSTTGAARAGLVIKGGATGQIAEILLDGARTTVP